MGFPVYAERNVTQYGLDRMSVETERCVCSWPAVCALKLGRGLWSSSADLVATWHDLINWLSTTCKFYRLAHIPVRGFFRKANATCLSDKCAVVGQIKIWERLPLRCLPTGSVWWEHSQSRTGIFHEIGYETKRWSSRLGWMKSKAPCLFVGVIILAHFIWCVCMHTWGACVPDVCRSLWVLEEAADLLDLLDWSPRIVSYHPTRDSTRAVSALKLWAIFLTSNSHN